VGKPPEPKSSAPPPVSVSRLLAANGGSESLHSWVTSNVCPSHHRARLRGMVAVTAAMLLAGNPDGGEDKGPASRGRTGVFKLGIGPPWTKRGRTAVAAQGPARRRGLSEYDIHLLGSSATTARGTETAPSECPSAFLPSKLRVGFLGDWSKATGADARFGPNHAGRTGSGPRSMAFGWFRAQLLASFRASAMGFEPELPGRGARGSFSSLLGINSGSDGARARWEGTWQTSSMRAA
jgi:hypothetical protein